MIFAIRARPLLCSFNALKYDTSSGISLGAASILPTIDCWRQNSETVVPDRWAIPSIRSFSDSVHRNFIYLFFIFSIGYSIKITVKSEAITAPPPAKAAWAGKRSLVAMWPQTDVLQCTSRNVTTSALFLSFAQVFGVGRLLSFASILSLGEQPNIHSSLCDFDRNRIGRPRRHWVINRVIWQAIFALHHRCRGRRVSSDEIAETE